MSDYDIGLEEFEQQVGEVLNGLRLHDCEWVDVTTFGQRVSTVVCAKCGTERQHAVITRVITRW